MNEWCVYMLRCSDDSLYTGVTNDLSKRLEKHRSGSGSKYVRSRLPISMAYIEIGHDQSSAMSREYEIKQMSKQDKESLV